MAARKPVKRRRGGRRDAHQIRIIGGDWKRSVLAVDDAPGLRPTGDRIRETLFNWLAPRLPGARCADLFAGTGVLGLEALSRGAGSCTFIDATPARTTTIADHLQRLGGHERARVVTAALPGALATSVSNLDIAFVDPPFDTDLLAPTLAAMGPVMAPGNRVYVEHAVGQDPDWPDGVHVHRSGAAGQVRYHLIEFNASTESP